MSASSVRLAALLGLASLRVACAAAASDCAPPLAPVPGRAAENAAFEWTALPAVPAPQAAAYRIGVWGDSLTSARMFIDAALQAAGIDKAALRPSFIQAGFKVTGLNLPLKAACASAGWTTGYAYREKSGAPAYSQGMLSLVSGEPGDLIAMDFRSPSAATRLSQLDILYDKARPDASLLLGVAIDGQPEKLIPLSRTSARALRLTPPAPMATVRIRVIAGQVTIHGFQPHYENPTKIVLDTMSVPGAMLRGWSFVDEGLASTGGKDYDLVLVQYGTNEGAAPNFDGAAYAGYLGTHLARVRKLHPRARCIMIGPPDRGVAGNGAADPMKYANITRRIALAQRHASTAVSCGFWDWQGEMGGPGTAVRWLRATPPLMQPDLTHMTAPGYQASGRLFSRYYPFPNVEHTSP